MQHDFKDLIHIFEQCFFKTFNTKLIKGGDEPLYSPADEKCGYHQIIFANGYYASALHEISHWCMAGAHRRLKEDFGYWYTPDGRNQSQQKKFEQVEIKPQAIEWALSVSTGKKFDVSVDNLSGTGHTDRIAFKRAVYQQVLHYLNSGFPDDAEKFIAALANFYQTPLPLTRAHFVL
jgi:elongation factor P hydroxylase